MSDSEAEVNEQTVTVTFITNHEIDPEEVDLRYKKPEKVFNQLKQATTGRTSIQEYANAMPVTREAMDQERRRIKTARRSQTEDHDHA